MDLARFLKVDNLRERQQSSVHTLPDSHTQRIEITQRTNSFHRPSQNPPLRLYTEPTLTFPPSILTCFERPSVPSPADNRAGTEERVKGVKSDRERGRGIVEREAEQARSVWVLSERKSRERRGGVGVFAWVHCREERERRGSGGRTPGRLAKAAVGETSQYGETLRGRKRWTHRASRSDSRRARMSFSRTGPLTFLHGTHIKSALPRPAQRADSLERLLTGQWSGSRRP